VGCVDLAPSETRILRAEEANETRSPPPMGGGGGRRGPDRALSRPPRASDSYMAT
jgi:hypothetical protein